MAARQTLALDDHQVRSVSRLRRRSAKAKEA